VDVGDVAGLSEVYAASLFRSEVSSINECPLLHRPTEESLGRGVLCRPVRTVDTEMAILITFPFPLSLLARTSHLLPLGLLD
jgi:hypothetical protein